MEMELVLFEVLPEF